MKKLHPIRKMLDDLKRGHLDQDEAKVARHIEPLLDALEEWHTSQVRYEQVLRLKKHLCHGDTCRLLSEWRRPL